MTTVLLFLAAKATVTFSDLGDPLDRLVPELGRACDLRLSVSSTLANDVVAMRVTDRPVEEVLAKLAHAVDGEWESTAHGRRLVSAQGGEVAQRRGRNYRLAGFTRAIATMTRREAGLPADGEAYARDYAKELERRSRESAPYDEAFQARSPEYRALTRMIAAIGPESLADLPAGKRVAWRLDPNEAQLAPNRALKALLASERVRANANVMLSASASPRSGVLFTLKWFDAQGARDRFEYADVQPEFPVSTIASEPGAVIDVAAITPESDAARKLAQPARFEPLSVLVGPVVEAVAKAKNEDFMAALPDRAIWLGASARRFTVATAIAEMRKMQVDVEEDHGWLCLRPSDPVHAREMRADRRALGRYASYLTSDRFATLRDRIETARGLRFLGDDDVSGAIGFALGRRGRALTAGGRHALRLMDALGDQGLAAATQGVPVAALNPDVRRIIDEMFYDDVDIRESFLGDYASDATVTGRLGLDRAVLRVDVEQRDVEPSKGLMRESGRRYDLSDDELARLKTMRLRIWNFAIVAGSSERKSRLVQVDPVPNK